MPQQPLQALGGSPRFYEILNELAILHDAKNHDYSGGAPFGNLLSTATDFGIEPYIGVFIRMGDKWARIKNFVKKGSLRVADESIIDSLRDLAVYAIIASIMIEQDRTADSNDSEDEEEIVFQSPVTRGL